MNAFDADTTRRLSIGLMAAAGALLFSAFDLIGSGIAANDRTYAAAVSKAVMPLASSALSALFALICAEIAAHPSTPDVGHPHSRSNYLQTAFVIIVVQGLAWFIYGAGRLIMAATIELP